MYTYIVYTHLAYILRCRHYWEQTWDAMKLRSWWRKLTWWVFKWILISLVTLPSFISHLWWWRLRSYLSSIVIVHCALCRSYLSSMFTVHCAGREWLARLWRVCEDADRHLIFTFFPKNCIIDFVFERREMFCHWGSWCISWGPWTYSGQRYKMQFLPQNCRRVPLNFNQNLLTNALVMY